MKPSIDTLLNRLNAGHYLISVNKYGHASELQLSTTEYLEYVNDIWGTEGTYGSPAALKEKGTYMVTLDHYGHPIEIVKLTQPEHKRFIIDVLGAVRA